MQTLSRTALVLILPAIVYLGASCDGTEAPTETAAPADGLSSSRGDHGRGDGNDKFFLSGTAQLDQDPENPANDVIRIRTDIPPFFGRVSRTVNVKIDKLDNMLEFKAWFKRQGTGPGKTCHGGAPRLQLAIDLNGDGTSEGNAHGYFGAPPNFTLCPQETWLYEDLTGPGDFFITAPPFFPSPPFTTPNEETEWDLTQFFCPAGTTPPGPPSDPCIASTGFVTNWSTVELAIGAFQNHRVCTVALVDDQFTPLMVGTAYYDLFSAGRATWTDRHDIGGRGADRGCRGNRGNNDDDDDDDDNGD